MAWNINKYSLNKKIMNIPKRIYLRISDESYLIPYWYSARINYSDLEYVPKSEDILSKLLSVICNVNNVAIKDVKGKCRDLDLVTSRREYCYLACKLTQLTKRHPLGRTLATIGFEVGINYATVLYHTQKIKIWLRMGKYNLKEKLEGIEKRLKI